ncbi:MAG TPA: hypothetical protein VKT73_15720 [Xanthobacteraceae bacterium]|nr:hypothetical protein [Xanthobacteraceae bacterium]
MYRVIIFLGIFLALVGVGAIAAGAPSWALGLGLGSSLIQSGSVGVVGGFLMVGIGFVLRALRDLSNRIDQVSSGAGFSRPSAAAHSPVGRSMPKREPQPGRREPPLVSQRDELDDGVPLPEPDAPFEDRPRGRSWPPATDPRSADARANERGRPPAIEPRLAERSRAPAVDPQSSGRGDFGAEPRRPRFMPERPAPDVDRAPSERGARGGVEPSSTVVRSGIIHGMAYTLYADGSIEAELPIGTVRFASIEELQDHVSRTGDEADIDFAGKPTN